MRRVLLLLTAVLMVAAFASPALAQGEPQPDCEDFTYQEDAQAFLEQDLDDPAGLDGAVGPASTDSGDRPDPRPDPGDGIACEGLPSRGSDEGAAPDATSPPNLDEGALPFTGPRENLLWFGVACLIVGVVVLGVVRFMRRT